MAGSNYHILADVKLNTSNIQAQLDALGKSGKLANIDLLKGKPLAGFKGASAQVVKMKDNLSSLDNVGKKTTDNISKGSKSMFRSIGDITKKVVAFGAITSAIQLAGAGIHDMVSNVFELDGALTEYKKVSNLTGKELDAFVDKTYKVGSTVARTGTEIVQASTEFKKMGKTDAQSLQLAKIASMFQNIADTEVSAGDAALFVNSQMKAFGIEGKNAIHIIDATNEVANNFAVGTNDLSKALTIAGTSLGTTGNTFEQTIGLLTSATELMPNKAQTVGNSFRTIGINIANMAKSTDTWTSANGKVNVSLKDSEGNLRSTYNIMKDLYTGVEGQSKAWNELSKSEQNEIAVQAAGKISFCLFRFNCWNISPKWFNTKLRSSNTQVA